MKGRAEILSPQHLCVNACSWVGVGADIFPIGRDLHPPPFILSSLYRMLKDVASKVRIDGGGTEHSPVENKLVWEVENPADFFSIVVIIIAVVLAGANSAHWYKFFSYFICSESFQHRWLRSV